MSEKCQLLNLVLQAMLFIAALHLCCCEGTSITLSPLGSVSVCSGGLVLLTCERMPGSFVHWDVSVPHLPSHESIVSKQGVFRTALQFNGLHSTFNITRTSSSPLTSQMMVYNVTTAINGSTIYCSEDGNENGAPMVTISVTNEGHPLNITLVNHFLRNSVTVTLQWPREAGAVYTINILPFTEITNLTSHNSIMINLTIPYDIQYNLSILSSLCGITTTKILKYVTCDLPSQLFGRLVTIVDTESRVIPYGEGEFIAYMCILSGFTLTGPNASVCTGNGEWKPDPGEVDCIADCRVPLVDRDVNLDYNSTLEGSVLTLTCENEINTSSNAINSTDEQTLNVTCHSDGNWIPDPAAFTCSLSTITVTTVTLPPGFTNEIFGNTTLIIIILLVISGIIITIFLLGLLLIIICVIKRKCVSTKTPKTSKNDLQSQEPMYDEISDTHLKGMQMKGNAAYGHMILASKDDLSTFNMNTYH